MTEPPFVVCACCGDKFLRLTERQEPAAREFCIECLAAIDAGEQEVARERQRRGLAGRKIS